MRDPGNEVEFTFNSEDSGLRDGGLESTSNNVLCRLKGYDTGMQLNDNLYIPTLIREYYDKMKQTVHQYYRELLM